MQEFDIAISVLGDVLDNGTPFNEALRKVFQANVDYRPMRGTVASLVGCELRHHLLFTYLTKDIADYSDEEKRFLALALANNCFAKHLDAASVEAALSEKVGPEKFEEAKPLLAKASDTNSLIPESVQRSSNEYLSLHYNTPIWVLKIWEHFGYGNTYKTLKKENRQEVTYLRVRPSVITEEEVLANPDFKATAIPNLVQYVGKTPLRRVDWFRSGKLFAERPMTKKVFDAHKVSEPSEVFLYNGNDDSSLEKELIETYGSSIGINLGTPDVDAKVDVTRFIKEAGIHNVNFFSAPDPLSMEAALSKKQDLVICAPKSTNFDLIRTTPDYLIHFNKDGMDAILEGEKNALYGCAKHVEENGTLIYMVYTISMKEGHATVEEFLHTHSEFELAEEKQHFPFEEEDTAIYVAILHQKPAQAVAEPPVDAALLNQQPAQPLASAAADAR